MAPQMNQNHLSVKDLSQMFAVAPLMLTNYIVLHGGHENASCSLQNHSPVLGIFCSLLEGRHVQSSPGNLPSSGPSEGTTWEGPERTVEVCVEPGRNVAVQAVTQGQSLEQGSSPHWPWARFVTLPLRAPIFSSLR